METEENKKITNKEKLNAVIKFLDENGLEYITGYVSKSFNVKMALKVMGLNIAVFLSDDNKEQEEKIFRTKNTNKEDKSRLWWKYNPFFIRESESVEFVLEKMQNCIEHRKALKERRERNKIYTAECNQRHLDKLARHEAHEKRMAEQKAKKEAAMAKAKNKASAVEQEKPKRKRQRIVRYEKV